MSTPEPRDQRTQLATTAPQPRALSGEAPEDVLDSGGGRVVTLAEILAVLAEQATTPPGTGQLQLRQDRHGPGLLAVAWRHTVLRQARAVLALFGAGLQAEARANARACLEHAVAVRRLALASETKDWEPLLAEMRYQAHLREGTQLGRLEELDADAGGLNHALLQVARREYDARQIPRDKTRPKAHHVKDVFDGVPDGVGLYSVYGQLSESTHAGLGSASAYAMTALRTGAPLPATPEPGAWAQTAALLCWSCWAAEDAMLRFLDDGSHLAARQVELLARINLAPG